MASLQRHVVNGRTYWRIVESRRQLPHLVAIPPRQRKAFPEAVLEEILDERVVSRRGRRNPRGVKRQMSNYPLQPRQRQPPCRLGVSQRIEIVK